MPGQAGKQKKKRFENCTTLIPHLQILIVELPLGT